MDFYGQAIEQFPEEASLYGNRSAALFMLKKFALAEQDCWKAITLDPQNPKVKQRLGKLLLIQGNLTDAKRVFEEIEANDQIHKVEQIQNEIGIYEKATLEENYGIALSAIN